MTDVLERDIDSFLSHHGIKGMRWGITRSNKQLARSGGGSSKANQEVAKNLISKQTSVVKNIKANNATKVSITPQERQKRDAKAKKFDDKAATLKKANAELDAKLKSGKGGPFARQSIKDKIKENDKEIQRAKKDSVRARQGKMSSGQKKLLIGTAVAGGILLAASAQHMKQSGQFQRLSTKGKIALNLQKHPFKKNDKFADPNLSPEQIMKTVVPGINPGYDKGEWGTNMNCRRCTFAYIMRRKGYDVEATRTTTATGQTARGIAKAFGRKKFYTDQKVQDEFGGAAGSKESIGGLAKVEPLMNLGGGHVLYGDPPKGVNAKAIFGALDKQPEGSIGELGVMWRGTQPGIPGGGHSVAYEIIKGKAHIFDTQTGEEYGRDTHDDVFDNVETAGFTRLDNVPLNKDFLLKWMK